MLAHERALQEQQKKASKGRQPGRRLTGQEALDAAQGGKWGGLFKR